MSITPEQLQQTIREAVAAAAQQWQEAAAQMRQVIGTLRTQVQSPPITSASLVDTRLLGKPFSFDGGAGWKDWSIVFQSCASACSAPLGSILERTVTQAEVLCSTQPYYMLVMLCKGTTLTRVVNAGAQEGLEAWRPLVLHHEPTSLTRNAGMLQELLNFSFEGEIAARMVQFDPLREIKRRELPEQHPHRSCLTHAAGRTIEAASCPQQCQIDHVHRSPWTFQRMVPRDSMPFRTATRCRAARANTKTSPGTTSRKRHVPSAGRLATGSATGWHNEANRKPKGKGKDGQGKNPTGTQQQPSGRGKNGVKCWNCDAQGHTAKGCLKKKQS